MGRVGVRDWGVRVDERERVWSWRVRSLGVVSVLVGSVKVGSKRSESGE